MRDRVLLGIFLSFAAGAALADVTVYRSVDANGIVSYSDQPPANGKGETIRVDADSPPPSPEVAERREAMRALTDELQASRVERERAAAEAAAIAAANQPAPESPYYDDYSGDDWYPVYFPNRPRPRWRQPDQPLPVPPIPRPNPNSASPRGLLERIRQSY